MFVEIVTQVDAAEAIADFRGNMIILSITSEEEDTSS